jgi:hypothetical protein
VGIPLDDDLRSTLKVKVKGGEIKNPTRDMLEKFATALRKHRSGDVPPATTPEDVAEWDRQRGAAARRAAVSGEEH